MRRTILATAFLAATASPAFADTADDCVQFDNLALKIEGCTAAIHSGDWAGEDLAWAYNNRALAYQHLGDEEQALRDIDMALELNPGHHTAISIRGFLRARRGEYAGAVRDWRRSFEIGGPEFIAAWREYLESFGYYVGADDGRYNAAMEEALFACSGNPEC